jgi:ribonuclease BN (tRNA processing enzyme)
VEGGGVRFLYAPDREHGDGRLDALFLEAARGATALITDAQYTPEEYPSHSGWGHTTWAEAARVAREAQVRSLVLFSHDPSHNDDQMRRIEGWEFDL